MKRDMNLIRKILFNLESREGEDAMEQEYEQDEIGHHCWLILDAGLAKGEETIPALDEETEPIAELACLTWEGHEFLNAARDDTRWAKTMKWATSTAGALTFTAIQAYLQALIRNAISANPPAAGS